MTIRTFWVAATVRWVSSTKDTVDLEFGLIDPVMADRFGKVHRLNLVEPINVAAWRETRAGEKYEIELHIVGQALPSITAIREIADLLAPLREDAGKHIYQHRDGA